MIGISKEELERMLIAEDQLDIKIALNYVIQQCKELTPWMTLEEFLESGFEGVCFYTTMAEPDEVWCGSFSVNNFINPYLPNYPIRKSNIHRVAPIHKPEPPK